MTRPITALLCSMVAASLLAACGSSSPSSSTSQSPNASAADKALEFSKCMREHGIKDFPNPEVGAGGKVRMIFRGKAGEGPTPQQMQAAQNACKRFQPAEQDNLTPQQKVERQEAVLKFAKCMREHGIDVHAEARGGGVKIAIHRAAGSGPNPESPAFQQAQNACQKLLPLKGGPGHSSSGASPGKRGGGAGGNLAVGG